MATAIEIINAACNELGLPTVAINSTTGDTLGVQALALLNALGDELTRVHDWQFLMSTMQFVGDGVADRFPMPADFKRQVNQTQWNTSNRRPMAGPDSPQMWSWNQFGIVAVGVWFRYRILGNEYAVFPVPGVDQTFDLYYINKNWVIDGNPPNEPKSSITLSNDTTLFDDRLLITGLKVKLWSQKGFSTATLQEEFNYVLNACKGQNQGAPVIDLAGGQGHLYINWQNVPDTGYGS